MAKVNLISAVWARWGNNEIHELAFNPLPLLPLTHTLPLLLSRNYVVIAYLCVVLVVLILLVVAILCGICVSNPAFLIM